MDGDASTHLTVYGIVENAQIESCDARQVNLVVPLFSSFNV